MKGHWKKQFNYEYLGSYSLDGKRDVVVTIKSLGVDKVVGQSGRKEECFVIKFKEFDKPMILNRTNSKAIEKVSGSGMVEDWVGVRVRLYVEKGVKAFGEVVDALRISSDVPEQMKMTKEIETAMLAAIKEGKASQVEMAIPNYKLTKEQSKNINEALKG